MLGREGKLEAPGRLIGEPRSCLPGDARLLVVGDNRNRIVYLLGPSRPPGFLQGSDLAINAQRVGHLLRVNQGTGF